MSEFEPKSRQKLEIPETTRIKPVIDQLRSITFEQVKNILETKKEDSKAGIGVANLSEQGIVPAVEARGFKYQFYIAFVPPKGHVKSHYHEHGEEPYRFMFADTGGEMNLGNVDENKVKCNWEHPVGVATDDEVEVQERQVHSYYNTTDRPVFFLFACPGVHLKDHAEVEGPNQGPDGDRYIIEGVLEDGVPPHHQEH